MHRVATEVLDAIDRFLSDTTRGLVQAALEQGMPAERVIAAIQRAIAPAIQAALSHKHTTPGIFATPTEGLQSLVEAQGGSMGGDEALERFGITLQAVNDRIKRGTLIALMMPNGQHAIPRWQLDSRGEVFDAVPAVLQALMETPGYSPLTAFAFFLQPSPVLGFETPLATMRNGAANDLLIDAAREFGRA